MKEIIILDTHTGPGGDTNVNFCFWFPVSSIRQVPMPSVLSTYRNADLVTEIPLIQSGAVIEEVYSTQIPAGTTTASAKSGLIGKYIARQTQLNTLPNPNQYYGIYWDSSVWSA